MLDILICPRTGESLNEVGNQLISEISKKKYAVTHGIPRLYVEESEQINGTQDSSNSAQDEITNTVKEFYEETPFPNYNNFDTLESFVGQANDKVFANMLCRQIPANSTVLEAGCGTGQLSNFLAATTASRYYAADMSLASLSLGKKFAVENRISGVQYLQMNLFQPSFEPETFDIVISNGVLHHTYDTKKAFMSLSRLVRPGGYIVIGLYNHIGRLRTDFRRVLAKTFGKWTLFLDPQLRKELSQPKRKAWTLDQYFHPQEKKHSFSEVVKWFDESGFSFISSIPKIFGNFTNEENLFSPQEPGLPIDQLFAEVKMLPLSYGSEGGLFICIGKKK
jgi:2-polyprenyl-3-methyl-5-hydroxy-6-metoxy-1,4-benzoquinol methylase